MKHTQARPSSFQDAMVTERFINLGEVPRTNGKSVCSSAIDFRYIISQSLYTSLAKDPPTPSAHLSDDPYVL